MTNHVVIHYDPGTTFEGPLSDAIEATLAVESLRDPEGVKDFMSNAGSANDWMVREQYVIQINDGTLPEFWDRVIVDSGFYTSIKARWSK